MNAPDPTPDPDELVTDSGGHAVRLSDLGTPPGPVDLDVLTPLRRVEGAGPLVLAGGSTYWEPGTVVSWHYGTSVDPMRVVRDDDRGLVAWLSPGTETLASLPVDGRGLRDRPLAERFVVAREMRPRTWHGPGVLRVAPTGQPWSVWYFWGDDGAFEGHYVNLELVHERPTSGEPRLHTRDLVLDLWVEQGEVWLKDADELAAAVECGYYSAEQGEAIRGIGDLARHELLAARAWPLDEDWESWRPPAGWEEPLALPEALRPVR